jgi:pilus assembly protein Flp/PilA
MGTDDRGTNMKTLFIRMWADKRGATAVEYGLILALIALAAVTAIRGVATETTDMWNNVSDTVVGVTE